MCSKYGCFYHGFCLARLWHWVTQNRTIMPSIFIHWIPKGCVLLQRRWFLPWPDRLFLANSTTLSRLKAVIFSFKLSFPFNDNTVKNQGKWIIKKKPGLGLPGSIIGIGKINNKGHIPLNPINLKKVTLFFKLFLNIFFHRVIQEPVYFVQLAKNIHHFFDIFIPF